MLLLHALPAFGWETLHNSSGSQLTWSSMPIHFDVNTDNAQGLDEELVWSNTYRAADVWAQVEGAEIAWDVGETDIAETAHDGSAVVWFNGDWQADESLLALASNWSTGEGQIVSFDIAVNSTHHTWGMDGDEGTVDLQNTLAHEFGHVLGFGHDLEESEATMWGSSGVGEIHKRDLHDSDMDGARAKYPGQGGEEGELPSLPFACSTGGGSPASLAPLLLAAVALSRARRGRCD